MSETQTVLAEIEIWHSRPFTPTRRLSLGNLILPTDHAPGLGGILLGGVVSAHFGEIDEDLVKLINDSNKFVSREEMTSDNQLMAGFGRAIWFQATYQDKTKVLPIKKAYVVQKIKRHL